MTRFDSKVTNDIIRKVHRLLIDVKTGEEIIDYLRAAEPVFMKEVGRFVQIELDKLKKDFPDDEDFLMYIGSLLGASYVMGFLIAREVDHKVYNGLINFESILDEKRPDMKYIDKFIDKELSHGKEPKEIGKLLHNFIGQDKETPPPTPKTKKKKTKRLNVDFDEKEL